MLSDPVRAPSSFRRRNPLRAVRGVHRPPLPARTPERVPSAPIVGLILVGTVGRFALFLVGVTVPGWFGIRR